MEAQVGPPGDEPLSGGENGGRPALMRVNIWIVLAILLCSWPSLNTCDTREIGSVSMTRPPRCATGEGKSSKCE